MHRELDLEFIVASAIGVLTTSGVFLLLRARTFPVVIGLALISYAVNVFLLAMGRLSINQPSVISKVPGATYADPLPQALVLTAIVISFGMTAVIVVMALRTYLENDSDHVDLVAQGGPHTEVQQ
jgi:multicomponent K+:H+ antiporter subunit C